MRIVSLMSITVLNSLVWEAVAHPLCYYDGRSPDPDHLMVFCPQQEEGACCNEDEEMAAIQVYAAAFPDSGSYPTEECAEYYRQYNTPVEDALTDVMADVRARTGKKPNYEFCT